MDALKPTISVCMIVKNEELQLEACVLSFRDIVNEIIVVDNGSTDNTYNKALELGCIVYDGSGLSESEARNFSLSKATCDWIFIIDADERFEMSDRDLLFKTLVHADSQVGAIELTRIDYIGYGKWSEIPLVRILKNGLKIKYNNSLIHPSTVPSIRAIDKVILKADIRLHHFDILQQSRAPKKRKKYKDLILCMLHNYYDDKEQKKDLTFDYIQDLDTYLGLEYYAEGEILKATELWKKVINKGGSHIQLAINLMCYKAIDNDEFDILEYYIKRYSEHIIGFGIWGNYYYALDKEQCVNFYKEKIKEFPNRYSSYINLAYLMYNIDFKYAKHLIELTAQKNAFFLKNMIYQKGAEPNIIKLQSSILKDIIDLKDFYSHFDLVFEQ